MSARRDRNDYQPMPSNCRGVFITKRYPDVPCALKGCDKIVTNRKNYNHRFCGERHREMHKKEGGM